MYNVSKHDVLSAVRKYKLVLCRFEMCFNTLFECLGKLDSSCYQLLAVYSKIPFLCYSFLCKLLKL